MNYKNSLTSSRSCGKLLIHNINEETMKRNNTDTNQPFKYGDTRKDGYRFVKYMTKKVKKDGFFKEQWLSPASFAKINKRGLKRQADRRETPRGRSFMLLNSARNRSHKKGFKVTITQEWIEEKIVKGCCELTGLPFDLLPSQKTRLNPYAPSLDRIDASNKNYSPENTRIVLAAVNSTLGEYGEYDILPILKAMVVKLEEKNEL